MLIVRVSRGDLAREEDDLIHRLRIAPTDEFELRDRKSLWMGDTGRVTCSMSIPHVGHFEFCTRLACEGEQTAHGIAERTEARRRHV